MSPSLRTCCHSRSPLPPVLNSNIEQVEGARKNNLAESAALNPTGDLTNAQFPMLNSHPKWMSDCQMFHRCRTRSHTCGCFSFRMRIEHWELNIGQILPSPHSAKLFLRGPLAARMPKTSAVSALM